MTEQEIDQLFANASPDQLERGMERLRYSMNGFEMGLSEGLTQASGGWNGLPTAIIRLSKKGIPTINKMIRANRTSYRAGANETLRVLALGYSLMIRWMGDRGVSIYVEGDYQRTNSQRPKSILRAVRPVVAGPVKIVVEVPNGRDIDGNYLKPVLDGFTEANFWPDDACIDELTIVRNRTLPVRNPLIIYIFEKEQEQEKGKA